VIFLVLSVSTFVASGLLFALLERRWPARGARAIGGALALELPYVLLSNALPGWAVGRLGAAFQVAGPLPALPLFAQWLVVLAVTELTFYAVHRAMHTWPSLWRLHAPHHAPAEMDWLAGFRKHTAEALLHGLAPLPVLVLLGPAVEVMLFHTLFGVVLTGFTHLNSSIRLGWLESVLVTPRVHAWHHAVADQRRNLAGKLTPLDRLFGSWNPVGGWPAQLGLSNPAGARDDWRTTHGLRRGASP
jgi:sterol desaturase/sphingolipid hydroxylase (fatty acid hydroxylase superfamily)